MSNETKHTDGPWRVGRSGDGVEIVSDAMPTGVAELATVHSSAEYAGTLPAEATARLMAAAPQLLAAAVAAREAVRHEWQSLDQYLELIKQLDEAISAAGGE